MQRTASKAATDVLRVCHPRFDATALGNYITYTVPVAEAGTYRVRVGVQTKPNKGKFKPAINGVTQGIAQDEYSPSVSYGVRIWVRFI